MGTSPPLREEIAVVTSFNKEMYEESGRRLLESWKTVQGGRIIVTAEGFDFSEHPDWYDLSKDPVLNQFLYDNRDIIPVHLGGLAEHCECRDWQVMHSKYHKKGCHWHWMNRNASRFFRKVATWLYAAAAPYRYMLWVDSDCEFIKTVSVEKFQEWLNGKMAFVFCGHREAVESGVVGFDLGDGGSRLIDTLYTRYLSFFRQDTRWDDGYQLKQVIDQFVSLGWKVNDLAHPTKYKNKSNHVMQFTDVWNYIRHHKGSHGRVMQQRGDNPIMQ